MIESIKDFSARSTLFIQELDRQENPLDDDDDNDDDNNEKNDGNDAAKSPQAHL